MRIWLSILFLFLSYSAFSQSCIVKGTVINKADKRLDFILVKCDQAAPKSTRTDAFGQFEMKVNQGETIKLLFDQIGSFKEVQFKVPFGQEVVDMGTIVLKVQQQEGVLEGVQSPQEGAQERRWRRWSW